MIRMVLEDEVSESYLGHREGLKKSFEEIGLCGQSDQDVLELLLSYAIPYREVGTLAQKLLYYFGSISGVFEAAVEDLLAVKGINEHTAVLLAMVLPLTRRYNLDKWKSRPKLETAVKAKEYVSSLFIGEKYEVFYLICMDSQCQLLRACRMSQGTIDQSAVYTRNIVEMALRHKAHSVMLAHNHPSGNTRPSSQDIAITKSIYDALQVMNIRLLDHIIVGGNDTYCFSSQGMNNLLENSNKKQLVAEDNY